MLPYRFQRLRNSFLGTYWTRASRQLTQIDKFRKRVFILAVLAYAVGVYWGMPSEVTCAFDASAMYSSLGTMARFLDPQFDWVYPQVHKLFLAPFLGGIVAVEWLLNLTGKFSSSHPYGFRYPVYP